MSNIIVGVFEHMALTYNDIEYLYFYSCKKLFLHTLINLYVDGCKGNLWIFLQKDVAYLVIPCI